MEVGPVDPGAGAEVLAGPAGRRLGPVEVQRGPVVADPRVVLVDLEDRHEPVHVPIQVVLTDDAGGHPPVGEGQVQRGGQIQRGPERRGDLPVVGDELLAVRPGVLLGHDHVEVEVVQPVPVPGQIIEATDEVLELVDGLAGDDPDGAEGDLAAGQDVLEPGLHRGEGLAPPESVRGLRVGAPVEYRGVQVGRVEDILIKELTIGGAGEAIPVLLTLQPGRLLLPDNEKGAAQMRTAVKNSVALGMRASLATGSLITGGKYISLDVHERNAGVALGSYAGRPTIPTLQSGLEGLEYQLSQLLDKLNGMPIEQLANSAAGVIESTDRLLASQSMQELPAALDETLAGVRTTLVSFSGESVLQERLVASLVELDRSLRVYENRLADALACDTVDGRVSPHE